MALGYKLFHFKNNTLYPLFIDKNHPLPLNEWMPAQSIPTKGFALRPGWHIGLLPDAPWLKNKQGCYENRIWAEVEYMDTIDYNPQLEESNRKDMSNIPINGFYRFIKTGTTPWIIAGNMRILRILSESERQSILTTHHYDEQLAFLPYQKGFEKRSRPLAETRT